MKKLFCIILSVILSLCVFCGCNASDGKSEDILILFTNDIHCAIEDGIGLAGLASYKKSCEENFKYVTLVDCGDAVQGSYLGAVSKGEIMVDLMNEIGYDYALLGNHEFDFGREVLKNNIAKANATYLCCNIDFNGSGDNPLSATKAYEIKEYGKTKVAFVGVSTPDTIQSSTPTVFKDGEEFVFDFHSGNNGQDLADCIQKNIDECRSKGADYVIVMMHMGVEASDSPFTSYELAAKLSGVDAILDGHSHTQVPCSIVKDKDGKDVSISQTGQGLNEIGRLVITKEGAVISGYVSEYEDKDEEFAAKITAITDIYSAEMESTVFTLDQPLLITDADGIRMIRSREMGIGNLVADSLRYSTGADIAYENGGGVRSNIEAGDVSVSDLINVVPFGNMVCSMKVSGSEVLDMLEYFVAFAQPDYVKDGKAWGEFGSAPQVSGLKFNVDTSILTPCIIDENENLVSIEGERRVSDVMVLENDQYVPIQEDKEYIIAITDYVAKDGGCGMANLLKDKELVLDSITMDYQSLIDYVNYLNGDLSRYYKPEGRINYK